MKFKVICHLSLRIFMSIPKRLVLLALAFTPFLLACKSEVEKCTEALVKPKASYYKDQDKSNADANSRMWATYEADRAACLKDKPVQQK